MMEALPSGWTKASIEELAGPDGLMTDGDWIESKDQDPDGGVRLIQLADIGDGTFQDRSSRFLTSTTANRLRCTFLEEGDLLIARMPDPLGRACIFPGVGRPSVTAVDVCVWRGGRGAADPRWLMHAINSPDVRGHIEALASGTTRQRISGGNLKRLVVPVPPLAEQRRIVDRVEALLTRARQAREDVVRAAQLGERYRQRVLASAFSHGDGNKPVRVGDLLAAPPSNGISVRGGEEPPGVRALRLDALREGEIDLSRVRYIDIPEAAIRRLRVQEGDFLVSRGNGSLHLLAKGAFAPEPAEVTVFPDTMIRLRFARDRVLPDWMRLAWGSSGVRAQIESKAKTTAGIWKVSQTDLESLELPVPPLERQAEIASRVGDSLAKAVIAGRESARAIALLHHLKAAVLARAFRGDLVSRGLEDQLPPEPLTQFAGMQLPGPQRRRRRTA